jgi:hypothetical protein
VPAPLVLVVTFVCLLPLALLQAEMLASWPVRAPGRLSSQVELAVVQLRLLAVLAAVMFK